MVLFRKNLHKGMARSIHIVQTVIPEYRLDFFIGILKELPDYNIFFYCSDEEKFSPKTSLNVHSINPKYFKTISLNEKLFLFKISFLKHFKRGDIVILEGNPRIINNYWIILFSFFLKYKTVWWSIYLMPNSKTLFFREQLMRFTSWSLLYTEREYEIFRSRNPYRDKVSYLNNTISMPGNKNSQNYSEDKILLDQVKSFLGDSRKNLIYIGRLTSKARLEIVLNFMKKNKDYFFVIVGDGMVKGEILSLINKFNLKNRVFLTGSIYDKEMLLELMGMFQLFVYPGSIGLSVFTAFSAGLPVITHNNEKYQAPEFYAVKNGFNSITYNYEDSSDFEAKVKLFFSSQNHELGNNALLTITRDYTMDKMIRNFVKMINQL